LHDWLKFVNFFRLCVVILIKFKFFVPQLVVLDIDIDIDISFINGKIMVQGPTWFDTI